MSLVRAVSRIDFPAVIVNRSEAGCFRYGITLTLWDVLNTCSTLEEFSDERQEWILPSSNWRSFWLLSQSQHLFPHRTCCGNSSSWARCTIFSDWRECISSYSGRRDSDPCPRKHLALGRTKHDCQTIHHTWRTRRWSCCRHFTLGNLEHSSITQSATRETQSGFGKRF